MTSNPPWLEKALSLIGTRETPGPSNNPEIIAWARNTPNLGIDYTDDSTAWCGLFAAYCVSQSGLTPPPIAVRAKAWATWGARIDKPVPGAVLVFERPGGGHVGFYANEDEDFYHVLGGNQADAVNVMRIAKERCIAIRWPAGVPVVDSSKIVWLGDSVSENEA